MTIHKGDMVSVINELTKGKVISITGNQIVIENQDGFPLTYEKKELVVYRKELDLEHLPEEYIKKDKASSSIKKVKKISKKEVDLHFEEDAKGITSILKNQISLFKKELNLAIKANQSDITFIHGVGSGKLRLEIEKILNKNKIGFSDAPYTKYGTHGAILIYLHGVKGFVL